MSTIGIFLTPRAGQDYDAESDREASQEETDTMSASSEDDQEISRAPLLSTVPGRTRQKRKLDQMEVIPTSETMRSQSADPSSNHARQGASRGYRGNRLSASVPTSGTERRKSSRLSIRVSEKVSEKDEGAPKRKRGRPPLKRTALSRLQEQPSTPLQPVRGRFSLSRF